MNFLLNMLDLLESAGLGKRGESLFLFNMPDTATRGIVLLSSLSGEKIDHELPGYRKPDFQIVARAHDYLVGHDLAKSAMEALTISQETMLDGMQVKFVRPRHEPVSYPVSDGNYIEWSVNFDATCVIV